MSEVGLRKTKYFQRATELFRTHNKIIVIGIDFVSSRQMQNIRALIREQGVVLMGKNTLIKTVIKSLLPEIPELEKVSPFIINNVGLVFTNSDVKGVIDSILSIKSSAPAKLGVLAQLDVVVPSGSTGLAPDKTNFFQALNIPTKVVKGSVEIVAPIKIITQGEPVSASAVELLTLLNILPFVYNCTVQQIYDNGSVYGPEILSITPESIMERYSRELGRMASLSMALNMVTLPAIPHIIARGYKNLLGVSIASDYTFEGSSLLKDMISNPEAYANVFATESAPTESGDTPEKADEEAKEETEDDEIELDLDAFF